MNVKFKRGPIIVQISVNSLSFGNSFPFTKQSLSHMRSLLGRGYAKSKTFCQKSQRSQIPFLNRSKSGLESQKSQNLTLELRKVKLSHKVYVKEVKYFSLRSQRVNLLSSKSRKSKKVKNPLQTSVIVTC